MNLGKQIESLLKRHEVVYVKGLGVFRRIHTSAKFDAKSNAFLPPISYIEFDAKSTDGADFISYLQQISSIEHEEAEQLVSSKVLQIIGDVESKGEATLDNLGTLLRFDGTYVFKPLDLSGFLYTPIDNDYVIPNQQSDTVESVPDNIFDEEVEENLSDGRLVESEESPLVNEELPYSNQIMEEDNSSTNKENSSYVYGLVAAIAILVLGGIYFYVTVYNNNDVIEREFTFDDSVLDSIDNTLDTLEESTMENSPLDTSLISQVNVDTIASTVEVAKVNVAEEKKVVEIPFKYTIVIGTHKTLEQANDEVASYHKKGHKTVRALSPNLSKNRTRVVWDVYKTKEERDVALREVRKSIKADAWGSDI